MLYLRALRPKSMERTIFVLMDWWAEPHESVVGDRRERTCGGRGQGRKRPCLLVLGKERLVAFAGNAGARS